MRYPFFTFDEKQQRATNFYVWESKEAAETSFSDEIAQIVDNSRS